MSQETAASDEQVPTLQQDAPKGKHEIYESPLDLDIEFLGNS